MNTELENTILAALLDLEAAVKSLPTASPKPNIIGHFEKIDSLAKTLPRGTDPGLLHYLHKKSYEKARFLLQGRDGENRVGNCDRNK